MFHKIFYEISVVQLPTFLLRHSDNGRYFQRETRMFNDNDRLKVKCTINPRVDAFKLSFFHRSYILWNSVPQNIREIVDPKSFKCKLEQHLWLIAENNLSST